MPLSGTPTEFTVFTFIVDWPAGLGEQVLLGVVVGEAVYLFPPQIDMGPEVDATRLFAESQTFTLAVNGR